MKKTDFQAHQESIKKAFGSNQIDTEIESKFLVKDGSYQSELSKAFATKDKTEANDIIEKLLARRMTKADREEFFSLLCSNTIDVSNIVSARFVPNENARNSILNFLQIYNTVDAELEGDEEKKAKVASLKQYIQETIDFTKPKAAPKSGFFSKLFGNNSQQNK
ncbi:MAG: hypothetical protein SFV53_02725 [Rickettsiales bacterium]|nr:hypothetical protein [Rickettsiales bacterium]